MRDDHTAFGVDPAPVSKINQELAQAHHYFLENIEKSVGYENNLISPNAMQSLYWVSANVLSKPYSRYPSKNEPQDYINSSGQHTDYAKRPSLTTLEGNVWRPNHGVTHAVRVMGKVRDILSVLTNRTQQGSDKLSHHYEALKNEQDIEKLQLVMSFYVAGRDSESGFDTDPVTYREYRQRSATRFADYARKQRLQKPAQIIFSDQEIACYEKALADPHVADEALTFASQEQNSDIENRCLATKIIINACHTLDLARCFEMVRMQRERERLRRAFRLTDNDDHALHNLFCKSQRQLRLTGNKIETTYDANNEFINDHTGYRTHLFRQLEFHPDLAIRLTQIASADLKDEDCTWLAIICNYHALRGVDALRDCITAIENAIATNELQQLIQNGKNYVRENTGNTRLIKVINLWKHADIWENFTQSLIDTKNARFELRSTAPRKPFAIRMKQDGTGAEIIATNKQHKDRKPFFATRSEKLKFARHQSTTAYNYAIGTEPAHIVWDDDSVSNIVGISVDIKQAKVHQITTAQTVLRESDSASRDLAELKIAKKIDALVWGGSVDEHLQTLLIKSENVYNEYLACLPKLTQEVDLKLCVFTDNLETRLISQIHAVDLMHKMQKQYPQLKYRIKIIVHPDEVEYTDAMQEADREHVKCVANHPLTDYVTTYYEVESGSAISEISKNIVKYLDNKKRNRLARHLVNINTEKNLAGFASEAELEVYLQTQKMVDLYDDRQRMLFSRLFKHCNLSRCWQQEDGSGKYVDELGNEIDLHHDVERRHAWRLKTAKQSIDKVAFIKAMSRLFREVKLFLWVESLTKQGVELTERLLCKIGSSKFISQLDYYKESLEYLQARGVALNESILFFLLNADKPELIYERIKYYERHVSVSEPAEIEQLLRLDEKSFIKTMEEQEILKAKGLDRDDATLSPFSDSDGKQLSGDKRRFYKAQTQADDVIASVTVVGPSSNGNEDVHGLNGIDPAEKDQLLLFFKKHQVNPVKLRRYFSQLGDEAIRRAYLQFFSVLDDILPSSGQVQTSLVSSAIILISSLSAAELYTLTDLMQLFPDKATEIVDIDSAKLVILKQIVELVGAISDRYSAQELMSASRLHAISRYSVSELQTLKSQLVDSDKYLQDRVIKSNQCFSGKLSFSLWGKTQKQAEKQKMSTAIKCLNQLLGGDIELSKTDRRVLNTKSAREQLTFSNCK